MPVVDREPRHADRVDHEGAQRRGADRAADPAVPAELREPADEGPGEHEPDDVAAGRAEDDLDPALVLREERQPDEADDEVQERGEAAAPHAERRRRRRGRRSSGACTGPGCPRAGIDDLGGQVDEDRAGDDEDDVPQAGRDALPDAHGTRKSAIVRPFSAAGTRVMDGIA